MNNHTENESKPIQRAYYERSQSLGVFLKRVSLWGMLLLIHGLAKPLWGYSLNEPTTLWTGIVLVLLVGISLCLVDYIVHTPKGRAFIHWDDVDECAANERKD